MVLTGLRRLTKADAIQYPMTSKTHLAENSHFKILRSLLANPPMSQRDVALTANKVAGLMKRPIWAQMDRMSLYVNVPRAPLPAAESLGQRVINIPCSSDLGYAAP